MAKGIPVVISPNGMPITPVQSGAPLLTVSGSGFGVPVTIAENAAPFVVDGLKPFDPSQLNPDAWFDPSDASTVFVGRTGTVPATAGSPVGQIRDKSGKGNHAVAPTDAARPTLISIGDFFWLLFDLVDDVLNVVLTKAINGFILIAGTKGTIIEPVSYAAGSTLSIGSNRYTGGIAGILSAVGGIIGVNLFDRNLTELERDLLIDYYKSKGAKGLLVPGPELVTSELTWGIPANGVQNSPNSFTFTEAVAGYLMANPAIPVMTDLQGLLKMSFDATSTLGVGFRPDTITGGANYVKNGSFRQVGQLIDPPGRIRFYVGNSTTGTISNISIRELRAQEDWV